jgi:outer membrane lipoprotein-sorting protein
MKSQFFIPFLSILMLGSVAFAISETGAKDPTDSNSLTEADKKLESILANIGKASRELNTFQSGLSYLTIQDPEVVESKTLQTGNLYYQKENDRSKLRIRFEKLQQDDFEPEKYVEDYYFDGIWLTKIDYKLEQVSFYQQAPENEPVDVFELINDRFPLIGFSGTQTLQKDFSITLNEASCSDPNEPIQLLLNVKEDSKYHESYKKIDFWINKNTYSPVRVRAYSTQGDIYDVRFFDVKINKKLQNGVFTIETPHGFRENREALESTPETKGP